MNKLINTSELRSNLTQVLSLVKKGGNAVIGKYDEPIAVIVPFPAHYNSNVSDMTNINVGSSSFDFLKDEPDIYTANDIIAKYEK